MATKKKVSRKKAKKKKTSYMTPELEAKINKQKNKRIFIEAIKEEKSFFSTFKNRLSDAFSKQEQENDHKKMTRKRNLKFKKAV